jgi:hypothetical protein
MAALKFKDTVFWLMKFAENAELRPLESLIVETLGKKWPGISLELRSDFAEEQLNVIASQLGVTQEQQREEGIEPTFELSYDAGKPYFRVLPSDAPRFRDALFAISDGEFVDFCVSLLNSLGAEGKNLDGTGDGGVDFIARNLPLAKIQGEPLNKARLLVIGQAKHYKEDSFVSEPEVRDFVGGGLKRLSDHTDSITHRGPFLAPVVFAFWTTGDFNSPAKSYARSLGIWTLNGISVSQLALKNGFTLDGNGKIVAP